MSTLNATPGAPGANSYATLAEANAYHEDRVAIAAWAAATDDQKRRALIQATRQLDAYLEWYGVATFSTQALGLPRLGLYDPDTGATVDPQTIPARAVWSVSEQAAANLAADRAAELPQHAQGIKSISPGGGVSIEFKDGAIVRPALVSAAFQYVTCWGRMTQASLGGAVSLARA